MGDFGAAAVVDDVQARRDALLARVRRLPWWMSDGVYSAENIGSVGATELADLDSLLAEMEPGILEAMARSKAEQEGYLARVREEVRLHGTAWLEPLLAFASAAKVEDLTAGQLMHMALDLDEEPIVWGPDGEPLND